MRCVSRWAAGWLIAALAFSPLAAQDEHPQSVLAAPTVVVERSFAPGPFGQVHVRIARPETPTGRAPLVLFHPTPYSGDYFSAFTPHMATDRIVIAIDTPGYGDSDGPPDLPTIADYARSAAAALEALGYGAGNGGAVDVLGYHTGCLIAAELAALRPDLVRRLVLPGVPFLTGAEQREAYEKYAKPSPVEADGAHLKTQWAFSTFAMDAGVSLMRAQEHFNDLMQCYPACWRAYHAVFTYDGEARFPEVSQPVLLISFTGSLDAETKAARAYFPNAEHMRFDDIAKGAFDIAPEKVAAAVRDFLDE